MIIINRCMIISSVIQTFGEDFYEVLKPSRFFRTKGNTSGCRVDGSDTGRPLENMQQLRDEMRRTAVTALAEVISCDCSQPSWRLGASRPESAMASLIISGQDGGRELGLEIFSRAYDIIQSRQASVASPHGPLSYEQWPCSELHVQALSAVPGINPCDPVQRMGSRSIAG